MDKMPLDVTIAGILILKYSLTNNDCINVSYILQRRVANSYVDIS